LRFFNTSIPYQLAYFQVSDENAYSFMSLNDQEVNHEAWRIGEFCAKQLKLLPNRLVRHIWLTHQVSPFKKRFWFVFHTEGT
jgi:hypothetical protein